MIIDCVNSLTALDALQHDWMRLHASDPRASVFTSWPWLRPWAEVSPYPWAVLVARDPASRQLEGLFPISPRGSRAAHRVDQVREIHTMGDPSADFRGFICAPANEGAVIDAFADHVAADRTWDRLILKDILDDRLGRFVARLRERDAREPAKSVAEQSGNECPLLMLPGTWEAYLSERLTPPSRKSLKKRLRIAREAGCFMTTQRDTTSNAHLDVLLRLAALRDRNPLEHLLRCRAVFESCLQYSSAEISVLWVSAPGGSNGAEAFPAAAQGSFIDRNAGSIGHYITGYDDGFAELSPGRVLDALCIQDAIKRGFKAVDFLRGDEPYKHQLGARPRCTQNVTFTRHGFASKMRATISGLRERLGG